MKQLLSKISEGYFLEQKEASEIIHAIGNEKSNRDLVNALLSLFLIRELTIDELNGIQNALLELSLNPKIENVNAIDLCGTGGDGKNTFNISTITSIVVAAAGVPVIKHGNHGVSSFCGSSDILNHFGYAFTNDSEKINRQFEKNSIVFLHAPLFHPVLKSVAEFRKSIGLKTIFNQLGPLINPAQPKFRMNGTYELALANKYSSIYHSQNFKYKIIHSMDGSDEITLVNDTVIHSEKGVQYVEPNYFGFDYQNSKYLFGGNSIQEASEIFISILENTASVEQRNIIIANAALAIQCYENCSIELALEKAKETIESKKALLLFKSILS